ncbi:MAG: gamma carbonic anhydrase family protein [Beijerinckiaceae bacterium]|jgi:carbonic anhydrase/acetyltransferase-like protein (isoleucine patch superfamily)|nr:gamma carbonic anhydrase family protein [Beijerinckiaceae bacterium]
MPIYALGSDSPDLPQSGRFWIAPDATIIGRVRLEEDVGIWFGCVLRGDNEWIWVGARSNVQEGTVMHTDPGAPLQIGSDCTIGHRAILHGCIIGDNTLIGMGATVLNRARIGRNCLVGANSLVTEGKEFPDNSLIVGSPAKLVRRLDEDEVGRLAGSAQRYVANWKRFARDLKQI